MLILVEKYEIYQSGGKEWSIKKKMESDVLAVWNGMVVNTEQQKIVLENSI